MKISKNNHYSYHLSKLKVKQKVSQKERYHFSKYFFSRLRREFYNLIKLSFECEKTVHIKWCGDCSNLNMDYFRHPNK